MSKAPLDPAFESATLVELLRHRARHQPTQRGYTFLVDGQAEEAHLTYGELDQRARVIAAQLQNLGVGEVADVRRTSEVRRTSATGARVLLLYPPGLDYLAAFFGC